jgi:hypothetical protein
MHIKAYYSLLSFCLNVDITVVTSYGEGSQAALRNIREM